MKRWIIIALGVLGILLVLPLVIPVPPLEDTVPPRALADPDSRFATLGTLDVHYKTEGQGETALVLLHGFGASTFSWRKVMEPLGAYGLVVAYDRPAFGLTSRPMPGQWEDQNPYSPKAAADLTIALMDHLSADHGILVGHSAGGSIAVQTALRHQHRIDALILVAPAVYEGGTPAYMQYLLRLPQVRRLGPLLVRTLLMRSGERALEAAWYDPTQIIPADIEGYAVPLRADNWDRALWELALASRRVDTDRLSEIHVPTLIITGENDTIVPPENSVRLAQELPDAHLVMLSECGHLPHEERPEAFLVAVEAFINSLDGR